MKYIRTYESYKGNVRNSKINEEILGDLLKSAKGAMKNFLNGILAPFKSLKDDFKKGMKFEEVKSKINNALDQILKSIPNNINNAKDENEINQMVDSFMKEIAEKVSEFDLEIKSIKESKLNEGVVQDTLIGGRVLFGILKDEYNRLKSDFDKKYAAAKDLSAKKQVAIARIKSVIDGYKKKINDEELIKKSTEQYKSDNDIKVESSSISKDILKTYNVKTTNDLIGKEVSYKKEDFDNNKRFDEQSNMVAKGEVRKIEGESLIIFNSKIKKEIKKGFEDILPNTSKSNPGAIIKSELGKIKSDPEKMKKIGNILPKVISNIDNDDKLKAAEDALDI